MFFTFLRRGSYASSRFFFSSISISRNSLDSNTAPHSLHSTYSVSSSRDTICTCGCLHCSGLTFLRGGCEDGLGIIKRRGLFLSRGEVRISRNWRILGRMGSECQVPKVTRGCTLISTGRRQRAKGASRSEGRRVDIG